METKILTYKQIREAAELIKNGELVAFPTETVYGLGANALDKHAVQKIFRAKGRPSDNPLIVHVAQKEQLHQLAFVKPIAEEVIERFWPGPLTIILKNKIAPKEVTGGLNTIAVRMPNNKIALELISLAGVPIAAPSANISGKPSGTSFKHVFEDFDGKIAGIIKSNACEIGLESTVIDLSAKTPTLLRPGGLDFETLKEVLPDLIVASGNTHDKVKSPGMKYKHYSPNAKIILVENCSIAEMNAYKDRYEKRNKKTKLIITKKTKAFSKELFDMFRQADKEGVDVILISSVEETGIGLAIMNRIRKAASKTIQG